MNNKDFALVQEENIKKPNCIFRHYSHRKTDSNIYHISCEDRENTFAIIFHTPPRNSKGTIHILEHMVLAGSKKYPINDPFFSICKKNVPTYCNAFVGDDFTCFFASSQISSDFYRIFDVYLDAVFHPLLSKETFLREAFRLEKTGERWEAKGIVLNEMKGALANPETILWESLKAQLFPDTHYAFDPGGIPLSILEVSHEEICSYHKEWYNPEQATFCFYGDLPIEGHFQFLEEKVFSQKKPQKAKKAIPKPASITTIPYTTVSYPGKKNQAEQIFGIAWVFGPAKDPSLSILAQVFEKILVGHDGALLSRKLIKNGFCSQVEGSVQEGLAHVVLMMEMYGVKEISVQSCEKTVLDLLKDIRNESIPSPLIGLAKNQVLINCLEITTDWATYGLETLLKGALPARWGGNFADFISAHFVMETLDSVTEDFLQKNIDIRFLGNCPRSSTLLCPEEHLIEAQELAIRLSVEDKVSKWDDENLKNNEKELQLFFQKQNRTLEEKQHEEACLPETPLSELKKEPPISHWESIDSFDNVKVQVLESETNGFIYLDLFFQITDSSIDLGQLSAWSELITKNGSKQFSALERLQRIEQFTSSFDVNIVIIPNKQSSSTLQVFLQFHLGFFDRFLDEVIDLILETRDEVTCEDTKRTKQVFRQLVQNISAQMSERSHESVQQLAASPCSLQARLENYIQGFQFYETLLKLQNVGFDSDFLNKASSIMKCGPSSIMICCESQTVARVNSTLNKLGPFPVPIEEEVSFDLEKYPIPSNKLIWPTSVFHHAVALPVNEEILPKTTVQLWSYFLKSEKLLPEIREKGGAYGASAKYRTDWRAILCTSYRDPRIEESILFFRNQLFDLHTDFLTESTLNDAKRNLLKQEELPIFPEMRGFHNWYRDMIGLSYEKRCIERQQIISQTREDMLCKIESQINYWKEEGTSPFEASFLSK
ncbi:insulinase family protein [Candidatus Similichlamydia epinepheli]|uniref:insulinase family protein n=1 Tax=Candidatus Similichlamydia epinepheli TaxID=1903953 RepID=UPI000D3D59F7|nr:insulinase family protein [Candidatus Similichlamydia epinepheli]